MSQDAHVVFGPLWGILTTLMAGLGVLELCGVLRAVPADTLLLPSLFAPKSEEPAWMTPRTTVPLALAIVLLGGLIGGPDALPLPLLVSLLVLLLSGLRRPALFVFVAGSLLLLPMLGQFRSVGSVGDALRRGRARDPGARRLDHAVVGARRVVLVASRS